MTTLIRSVNKHFHHIFFFHHIHIVFLFPLQINIPLYYTSEFWILSSNIKTSSMSLFYVKSSKFIFCFSKKLQYTKRRKKRRRKREEKYEMKKRRTQKERGKEKEAKKEKKNKKSEKKEKNMGKLSLPYKYHSITSIPFPPCLYQFYLSTPSPPILHILFYHHHPHHFGRIIQHQWYLSFYIIQLVYMMICF